MRCFFATFLATAGFVIPFAQGQQTSKNRLESEILPSFQSILNVDKNGVCAAEPGPAVCSAQASSIATKMTEVNSYTSFDSYVDTLADASLFLQDCWSCLVSDLKSNTHQVEQLCGALEDASYALKYVFYKTTPFPTSPLCMELLTEYGDHKSEFNIEMKMQQDDVRITTSTYTFDKCQHFEGLIKIDESYGQASAQDFCNPQAGKTLGHSVDIGEKALGIILDGSSKLPYIGFAASSIKAIYDYICAEGEDTGAGLDAAKVFSIATEAAKDSIRNLIRIKMTNIHSNLEISIDVNKGYLPARSALSYASAYMNLSTEAGSLGIGGYKTAVGALSHALSLLALAKNSAESAGGQSECVEEIDAYFRGRKTLIQRIEETANTDFEDLGREMKSSSLHHRHIKKWVCFHMMGMGIADEVEAYSQNRRGEEIVSTRARFNPNMECWPTDHAVSKAKEQSKHHVDTWLSGQERDLFEQEYKDLFKNIREGTTTPPADTPTPTPAPTPAPTPFPRPCMPFEYCDFW